MKRTRSFVALGIVFLLPILSACVTDSTGPGDDDDGGEDPTAVVSDRIVVSLQQIEVVHDCDPNTSNPGDFQSWVEIWQDADPTSGEDYRLLASSPKRTLLINSGESRFPANDIRAETTVLRVRAHTVSARVYVRELDNGVVDASVGGFASGDRVNALRWWDAGACWQTGERCMASVGARRYREAWTSSVKTRDDVHDIFNPDDEGCEFKVTYDAYIGEP